MVAHHDEHAAPGPMTPTQERVWRELLAVGEPRPRTDPELVRSLRSYLEEGTAAAAALVPGDERLWLNKSALDALDCEGRFLDRQETPFAWTAPMVRGQVAHTAIEIDTEGRRARKPDRVLAFAWGELASRSDGAGRFVAGLGGVEADALRADVRKRLLAFRECFPTLPPSAETRTEVAFTVNLHGGRIVLKGVPDLVIGRATPTHRRMHLLDLKTGRRHRAHRHDMRLYALLATLKLGVAPFRVSTFYLDEAEWEHEDVDEGILEAVARTVVDKAQRAARLTFGQPDGRPLQLVPGPACQWCGRAADCGARILAEAGSVPDRSAVAVGG